MKYMAVLSLLTSSVWGQNSPHTHPLEYGGDGAATATRSVPTSPATPHPHQEGQRPLSFDDVFQIVTPLANGTYADSADNNEPDKKFFSIKNAQGQERHFAVDKDLVLGYSNVLRKNERYKKDGLFLDDGPFNLSGYGDMSILTPLDEKHFKNLINLLFIYDQNPAAFQDDHRLEMDLTTAYGVLHLANVLFSDNEKTESDGQTSNDLGFFHVLQQKLAPFIFDEHSLPQKNKTSEETNLFSPPLPIDAYNQAFSLGRPADVYVFYKAFKAISTSENVTFDQDAFNLLTTLHTYFTTAKLSIAWTELKAMPHRSPAQQDALERLSNQFINFVDITPGQDVSQTHILITPSELNQNTDLNQFFTQNSGKILIVDFGNATTIHDNFSVPPEVRNLVIVGENITTVGNDFLDGCLGLASLVLSSTLKTVGDHFLDSCLSLTSIKLPTNLTTVGSHFLSRCSGLTSLYLPTTLTTVGKYFLSRCSGLTSLYLPTTLTTVGKYFLYRCSGLTSLVLPSTLKTVDDYFLLGCYRLTSIKLPTNLTTVGRNFLYHCLGLKSLILSQRLASILDIDALKQATNSGLVLTFRR
jgi:hypothetical protein